MAHLRIVGRVSTDYFDIVCEHCGESTRNEYLGGDPVVPHFKATCPKCKSSGQWKLNALFWKGLPTKPSGS